MPLKKSDLYSSLWTSCDELRGGMHASQYNDYVLFQVFIKSISQKHGDSNPLASHFKSQHGSSFNDMDATLIKPSGGA
jgi:type I restriction enzyme M protein